MITAEDVAKIFHEVYEGLAPRFGYETRCESHTTWEQIPEKNRLLMIATAEAVLARIPAVALEYAVKNLGEVKNGDVIIVRYVRETPDSDARKKDYTAIRNYFQNTGLTVRLLGISGEMMLEKANPFEMAQFGWYKRR